jgi:hypothetical protein
MSPEKIEYPPLLPAGFHRMSLEELRKLCVNAKRFSSSSTRGEIMSCLEQLGARLIENGIAVELWIDGSFVTQKADPEDVDLSVRFLAEAYDGATDQQRMLLDEIQQLKDTDHIDGYLQPEWPPTSPHHTIGLNMFDYWQRQWGFGRNGEPKGIVVVELTRSDQ